MRFLTTLDLGILGILRGQRSSPRFMGDSDATFVLDRSRFGIVKLADEITR